MTRQEIFTDATLAILENVSNQDDIYGYVEVCLLADLDMAEAYYCADRNVITSEVWAAADMLINCEWERKK